MSDPDSVRVHFLDVGQGSSSVIHYCNDDTGDDEFVVIDCGRHNTKAPYALLNDYILHRIPRENRNASISALILTHNDLDHSGGADAIIRDFWKLDKIGKIFVIHDSRGKMRSAGSIRLGKTFRRLKDDRLRFKLLPLAFDSGQTKLLHQARVQGRVLEIHALAPLFSENYGPENPNQTSGVIRLRYDGRCVLFCGDFEGAGWKRILSDQGRIKCDAVLVPHHGGKMRMPGIAEPEKWFFQKVVDATVAILSFSASNSYKHPSPEVVNAAMASGATVLCTQVTPHVFATEHGLGSGVVEPRRFSLSAFPPRKREEYYPRRHVACAGSITLRIGPDGIAWGHQGDGDDPVCGFEDLAELEAAIRKRCRYENGKPECHKYCS